MHRRTARVAIPIAFLVLVAGTAGCGAGAGTTTLDPRQGGATAAPPPTDGPGKTTAIERPMATPVASLVLPDLASLDSYLVEIDRALGADASAGDTEGSDQ